MTTTLITGANTGLGKEVARQLVAAGHTVYVGARDEARGRAAAEELGARFVQLNVTDDASVAAALAQIEADGGLDVLINNAGIAKRSPDGRGEVLDGASALELSPGRPNDRLITVELSRERGGDTVVRPTYLTFEEDRAVPAA